MVDVSAIDPGEENCTGAPAATALDCRVGPLDAGALARYAAFTRSNPCGPHQSPLFLRSWQEATGAELMLVEMAAAGRTVAMLPLEVASSAICRTACFAGHSHANGNFVAVAQGAGPTGACMLAALRAVLRRDRPDIDVLALERMAPALEGRSNPLAAAATGDSPDVALSVGLHGGFEALLDRSSGKRKRKKYRSQLRKFESAGGWRLVRPQTAAEVDLLLDGFFAMKAERFAQMGISNVFAEPGMDDFMRRLFASALEEPEPPFRLRGLEIGGQLRAVTGSSVLPTRIVCDVSAIATDDMAGTSPGDFLFFEMIREACEERKAVFDFSVGDEYYKRLWCDTETWQSDIYTALSARGSAVATVSRSIASMKRAIKSSPLLWSLAKRIRRGAHGRDADHAPAHSED